MKIVLRKFIKKKVTIILAKFFSSPYLYIYLKNEIIILGVYYIIIMITFIVISVYFIIIISSSTSSRN